MSNPNLDDADWEDAGVEPEQDEIGMTSEESSALDESPAEADNVDSSSDDASDDAQTKTAGKRRKFGFSVFDAMLLISLVCVALATVLLVLELRDFGNFPFSYPWRTTES